MNVGTPIPQYEKAQSIPSGTTYIADMGDGSGTKGVTQEVLTKEVGRGLKIGDTEELQTTNKESIVAAINEAAQSGGGSSVDILDSKEEIEANTESGKAAGAQALKEMFSEIYSNLGGLSFGTTEDGQPGWKDGADAVHPFNRSFKFAAHLYSWATQILLYDCPRKIKFECKYTIYLFNADTGVLISSGTSVMLENNVVKNIKIKAVNNFSGDSADGFGAPDGVVTVTIH